MRVSLFISFVAVCFLHSCTQTINKEESDHSTAGYSDSIKILRSRIDSLSNENLQLNKKRTDWFSEQDVKVLKSKGLTDPLNEITTNLANNATLIPYPAVLGGKMRFHHISLLGDRWAIADFDDGHNMGTLLLKYHIQKDGSLKWTIIDKYLK
jgi:hypothetical protein